MSGKGFMEYPTGASYYGDWKDGKWSGQGVLIHASGNKYTGEFVDGKKQGYGVFTWTNGDVYAGHFKDDKLDGEGMMIKGPVDRYYGEYKDGKRNGKGLEISLVSRFDATWENDVPSGYGAMTHLDRTVFMGEWQGRSEANNVIRVKGTKAEAGAYMSGKFIPADTSGEFAHEQK